MLPVGVLSRPRRRAARADFGVPALPAGWARTDTENKITVSGGQVVVAGGKAAPAFDDPRLTYTAKSWLPKAGLVCEAEITWTAFGATGCDFGFDNGNPVTDGMRPGFQVFAGGVLWAIQAQGAVARQATAVTLALNTPYRFRVRLLDPAYGVQWSFSADRGQTWAVVFVDGQYPTLGAPLWMGFTNNDAACKIEYLAAAYGHTSAPALSDAFAARTSPGRADTGQPWLVMPGRAAPLIAGDLRIPAGSIETWPIGWDGVADGVWECDLNFGSAPGATKFAYLYPRYRDASNALRIVINRVTQIIQIVRLAGGVGTQVALLSSAGFADNTTYHFTVACIGPTIKVYQDGVERVSGAEPFGQYFALFALQLSDTLATPDIRVDNVRAWGTPLRPLLMDSFDRPDSATAIGRADSGQAYVTGSATPPNTAVWGIGQGSAKAISASGGDRWAFAPLGRASFVASAILRSTLSDQTIPGVMLRYQDAQNYVALRLVFTAPAQISVLRNLAGVRSSLGFVLFPAILGPGYLVTALLAGNTLETYIDGVRQQSLSVTDFPTAPVGGPYAATILEPGVDDLRVLPFGTVLQHDTFTRTDSATSLGNTELPGTPWLAASGTWGIATNQGYCVTAVGGVYGCLVPSLAPDVDVSCDLVRQADSIGLFVRADATLQNYLRVQASVSSLSVVARVAGDAGTTLGSVNYAWAASATARAVRVRIYQGILWVYVDGVLVLAQAFGGHAGAGELYAGPFTNQAAATNRFDNFLVREVPAVPMPPLASDTFSRPDNATSLGNSEVPGTAWGGTGVWGVSAGQAYSLDTTTATKLAVIPMASQNVRVEADVTFQNNTPGVTLRATATVTDYLRAHLSGAFLNLFERVAGVTASALAVVPPPGGWAAGQTRRLGLEATTAGLLRLFLDGGLVAAVPFTGHAGPTENGAGLLTAQSATTNRWDNFLATVVPVPGACPGIADDFARPDSVLSMGNTPAPWVAAWVLLNSGANWGIVGGKAYSLDTSVTSRGAFVWHGLTDFTVQADMTRAPSGATDQVGFWLRCAVNLSDYLYVRTGGVTLAVIERVAAGSSVSVASASYVWNLGETRRMRCTLKAGVLTVYIDDVLLITQAIAGHPAVTEPYAGLYHTSDTAGARFDNFSLVPA